MLPPTVIPVERSESRDPVAGFSHERSGSRITLCVSGMTPRAGRKNPLIPHFAAPNASHRAAHAKLIQHLRPPITLACMCDDLKRDFYAACPVWYWPVLWWQFMLMERHLAELYAARGRGEMTYGLSLGQRGQLRLIFLSDAERSSAEYGTISAKPLYKLALLTLDETPADYTQRHLGPAARPPHTARMSIGSSPLYLDPG